MRYCPGCGSEVEVEWEHCPDCGEGLNASRHESVSQKSTSQESTFSTARKLTLGGLVLVVVGAFLPWVSASVFGTSDSVIGINTLGVITLVLAAVAGFGVLVSWSSSTQTLVLLAGIAIALVAAYGITNPVALVEIQLSGLDEGLIHPDSGLYGTLLGGILVLTASGYALKNDTQTSRENDEEPSFFTLYWLPGFSE